MTNYRQFMIKRDTSKRYSSKNLSLTYEACPSYAPKKAEDAKTQEESNVIISGLKDFEQKNKKSKNKLEGIVDTIKNSAKKAWKLVKYGSPVALGLAMANPANAQSPSGYNTFCGINSNAQVENSGNKYNISAGIYGSDGKINMLEPGTEELFAGNGKNLCLSYEIPLSAKKNIGLELGLLSFSDETNFHNDRQLQLPDSKLKQMRITEQIKEILLSKKYDNSTIQAGVSFDNSNQNNIIEYKAYDYNWAIQEGTVITNSNKNGMGFVVKGNINEKNSKVPFNFGYRVHWLNETPNSSMTFPFKSEESKSIDQSFYINATFKKGLLSYIPFYSERNTETKYEYNNLYYDSDLYYYDPSLVHGDLVQAFNKKYSENVTEKNMGVAVQFQNCFTFYISRTEKSSTGANSESSSDNFGFSIDLSRLLEKKGENN